MLVGVLLAVALGGCDTAPGLVEEPVPALTDADGDGATPTQGDCDDANASVGPGAPELCNGFDDNCDGAADEEPTVSPPTWYADTDGDRDRATKHLGYSVEGLGDLNDRRRRGGPRRGLLRVR